MKLHFSPEWVRKVTTNPDIDEPSVIGGGCFNDFDLGKDMSMSNSLQINKACADAMGEVVNEFDGLLFFHGPRYTAEQHSQHYDPLNNDTQAIALLKRFQLCVEWGKGWVRVWPSEVGGVECIYDDFNYAVCNCVALIQLRSKS